MATALVIPLEERILRTLRHLGIQKAHFAGLIAGDWQGLAVKHPEVVASLTLVCPIGMTQESLAPLATRLLVFAGDQGSAAQAVQRAVGNLPDAEVVIFEDYETPLFADVVLDHGALITSRMLEFLDRLGGADLNFSASDGMEIGEVAEVTYRIQGAGPPLVLLPLALACSQWGPIVPQLAEKYSVITLGGAHLGSIRDLETRARTGFRPMVNNLMADLQIRDGESVLDVGCGSGAHARDLALRSGGKNRIAAVDYSPYMVAEARSIASSRGLDEAVDFRLGNAEALPFPNDSFDVVYSVTVMEEVNADRMIGELMRLTRPGGRIGAIVRANDSFWVVNLPISDDLKRKVEPPGAMGGGASAGGCADRSLYVRFAAAGLERMKISAQLATFSQGGPVPRWEAQALGALSFEEAEEWRRAAASAKADGTFFIAAPFHCAVGTVPQRS
jgi:SAM-dependent methyltransferase